MLHCISYISCDGLYNLWLYDNSALDLVCFPSYGRIILVTCTECSITMSIDSTKCPIEVSSALFRALVLFLKCDSVPVADHGTHKVDWTVDAFGGESYGVGVLLASVAVVRQHLSLCPRKNVPLKFIVGE